MTTTNLESSVSLPPLPSSRFSSTAPVWCSDCLVYFLFECPPPLALSLLHPWQPIGASYDAMFLALAPVLCLKGFLYLLVLSLNTRLVFGLLCVMSCSLLQYPFGKWVFRLLCVLSCALLQYPFGICRASCVNASSCLSTRLVLEALFGLTCSLHQHPFGA